MSIIERTGDLLKSDCDVILHQANCQSVMGAGIAKQIKREYPAAFAADKNVKLSPAERFGTYSVAHEKNKDIVNLYGQQYLGKGRHIGDKPADRLNALERALRAYLFDKSGTHDLSKLKFGVPAFIGCGLAGGNWQETRAMLERVALDYNIQIHTYLFKP